MGYVMQKIKKTTFLKILTGTLTGMANGLFGGGGGMILVPMLEYFLKKDKKSAHATAILIILPVTLISSLIYLIFKGFDFSVGVPVGIGSVFGGVIGAYVLKKMNNSAIVTVFSLLMIVAGVKMTFF